MQSSPIRKCRGAAADRLIVQRFIILKKVQSVSLICVHFNIAGKLSVTQFD